MTLPWKRLTAFAILSGLLATEAAAQLNPVKVQRGGPSAPQLPGEPDAQGIRISLDKVFRTYPPSLRQVLQLDSSTTQVIYRNFDNVTIATVVVALEPGSCG